MHPALQEVPQTLCDKHEYDEGLICNCEPVVITTKTTYGPCRKQYPLKQEANDGITSVFEILLHYCWCHSTLCLQSMFFSVNMSNLD